MAILLELIDSKRTKKSRTCLEIAIIDATLTEISEYAQLI